MTDFKDLKARINAACDSFDLAMNAVLNRYDNAIAKCDEEIAKYDVMLTECDELIAQFEARKAYENEMRDSYEMALDNQIDRLVA